MRRNLILFLILTGLLALTACDDTTDQSEEKPIIRPVLTLEVRPEIMRSTTFAGTIDARYKSVRAFQLLGRITQFNVTIGDIVTIGEMLAQLDPTTFDLAIRSSEAELDKAQSALRNAQNSEARTQGLVSKGVSSQAALDSAIVERKVAQAAVDQAKARLASAHEDRSYANLVSDINGVVTKKTAELGQTVNAGETVIEIAQTDPLEAIIDVPEETARALKPGMPFTVTLDADNTVSAQAHTREIAPEADAKTRTRRVRMTLDDANYAFRIGATIFATPHTEVKDGALRIPATAILRRGEKTFVWIVNETSQTVTSMIVSLAPSNDPDSVVVTAGLSIGDRVVIAGVHSLSENQTIRLEESVE
jgi:membrane fusion protein, multidrug efflux system